MGATATALPAAPVAWRDVQLLAAIMGCAGADSTATCRPLRVISTGPPVASELKPQLRTLLQYHCGSPLLRTRQFMMDMQSL